MGVDVNQDHNKNIESLLKHGAYDMLKVLNGTEEIEAAGRELEMAFSVVLSDETRLPFVAMVQRRGNF